VLLGWLIVFSNLSIFHTLADHSGLRNSSFDPLSATAHSPCTVSSCEPGTPGLREPCCFRRPEENPCQSGFFSGSPFFFGRGHSLCFHQDEGKQPAPFSRQWKAAEKCRIKMA